MDWLDTAITAVVFFAIGTLVKHVTDWPSWPGRWRR